MSGGSEDVRDEFLAESQEIIEALSRDLLVLDHAHKDLDGGDQGEGDGEPDPELLNAVFRGVHTLKGMAGMFGYESLGECAHLLEDLLDGLRLGRVALSTEALDALFLGIEVLQELLNRGAEPGGGDLGGLREAIASLAPSEAGGGSSLEEYELDPGVLSVLTEYEEHRLRTNIAQGVPLYRLKVRFALTSIDTDLEELKAQAKEVAELITYLPSMEGTSEEAIELEVLLASRAPLAELREELAGPGALLEPVARRIPSSVATAPGLGEQGYGGHGPGSAPGLSGPGLAGKVSGEGAAGIGAEASSPSTVPPRAAEASLSTSTAMAQPTADRAPETSAMRAVARTVRVDIAKLDHLMNLVGELSIVRSGVGRVLDRLRGAPEQRKLLSELHRIHRAFSRHLSELQDGVLDVRMVPLRQTFDRLARAVRQIAREEEKEVRLLVAGAETEVDKLIVEELTDPLLHIVRNAIDHGIESAQERLIAGKDAQGTIALNAYHKGNHVVIEVEDDGAGLRAEGIKRSAVERGVIAEEVAEDLSFEELVQLIFVPGLSTASTISEVSGRGVGMDVVKTNIGRLGGVIDVQSAAGVGTTFTITLPITLAILSALVVRVAKSDFAIPLNAVQEALILDRRVLRWVEDRPVITLRGATLPICDLSALFELDRGSLRAPPEEAPKRYVVVSSLGQRRLGLIVHALEGQQDIIIKPLGPSLRAVRGFAGATDLGDQRVALVLDAPAILEEVLTGGESRLVSGGDPGALPGAAPARGVS